MRCGETRPCPRCTRLGLDCFLSIPPVNNLVTPYQTGGYLPKPSTESIFQHLHSSLDTVSPLVLGDLLSSSEMAFQSGVSSMCSVIPFGRRRDYLERMVTLAALPVYRPEQIGFVANRVQEYLEPQQAAPLLALPVSEMAYMYHEINSLNKIKKLMEYYLHKHDFVCFPMGAGCRPGVMATSFIDPDLVDGANNGLIGTLNAEAEIFTGYTCEEYHSFQNVITPDFYCFDGFPQVLKVYHKDDIQIYMENAFIAFLNPKTEVLFEARLIHKNGHVVHARFAHFAIVKTNGQMKSLITAFVLVEV